MNELKPQVDLHRARQITASYFVNELQLDCDTVPHTLSSGLLTMMAANWGNWQYIAGVGAIRVVGAFNITSNSSNLTLMVTTSRRKGKSYPDWIVVTMTGLRRR